MSTKQNFSTEKAKEIAEQLGLSFSKFSIEEFRRGMNVELEHGLRDSASNVTNNDPILTAKIALAHLNEFPDYYTRLDKMEAEAEAYWENK